MAAANQRKKAKTPALLPWIPAGKPTRKDTFNLYAHKKNSKLELDLGHSVGGRTLKELKEDKEFLSNSQRSEEERKKLKDKIMGIVDGNEDDEAEIEEIERRGRLRAPKERSRRAKSDGEDSYDDYTDESRSRSRSRSRARSADDDDDHYRRRHKNRRKGKRRHRKKTHNQSTDTSGIGSSVVEDIEDRHSIEFIDNMDANRPQIVPAEQIYPYQLQQQQRHTQFSPLPPNMQLVQNPPQMQLVMGQNHHQYPNNNVFQQSMHQSDFSNPSGFQSVDLINNNNRTSRTSGAPEAWLVFPKGAGRRSNGNFTARPVNFATSIGSRLKESFSNINKAKSSPVERLLNETPEQRAARRKQNRKMALIVGSITALVCAAVLAIAVGVAIGATNNGGATGDTLAVDNAFVGSSDGN